MQLLLTKTLLFFLLLYPNTEISKSDKVLISDVKFDNGLYMIDDRLINGEIIDYYENEKLKFRYRVLEGRLHGIATEFYKDGSKKSEKKYTFNKLFGTFKEYYKNGDLKAQFDVGLNAYGSGEKVSDVKIAVGKKRKLKGKDDGIIFFLKDEQNIKTTSEMISILNQSNYKIVDDAGKLIFKN
ncbi:toxin-antitoxin system YwqK family antitoxin [Roseivirga sp.]|uniref:toxin-antitoxin system YwqK family antitoxin n=1 Tax=Roseivirga sp. TaxID=1964215 RepID=UPI003B8C79A8